MYSKDIDHRAVFSHGHSLAITLIVAVEIHHSFDLGRIAEKLLHNRFAQADG